MGRLEDENRPKLSHPTHAPLSWFPGGARQKRGELTRNREGEIYNSDKIKIQEKKGSIRAGVPVAGVVGPSYACCAADMAQRWAESDSHNSELAPLLSHSPLMRRPAEAEYAGPPLREPEVQVNSMRVQRVPCHF